ncbi:hypothetical protein H2201_008916 [Coniosporium apollinis]|uniref:FAD dependent oxidoreductase domain-containing protein n=2 Tax=Coniosporium TaxID=2810619 RepID=A0ABQ9NJ59_9PEZI|nr:hypothetical protein H2199_009240 [Cladosporium sp. JES 115]KAJ9654906.1 hypothetical protein H2201_008916 [Coniosporium apollinis]
MLNKHSPVIIVGGGAFGLSTALHLSLAGYSDITVFERDEKIPSKYSAAYDINKIVRAEYEDEFYTQLALDVIEAWKNNPIFNPYYHQTGYIVATSGSAPSKARDTLQKSLSSLTNRPAFRNEIKQLSTKDDFRKYAWQITGPLKGFKGYFNRIAGYAHSANSLKSAFVACAQRGIRFVTGEEKGKIVELLYEGKKCVGVKTADGKVYKAETTIVALGAYAASLIPSVGNFAVARCWSVAHVQLTEEETDLLRGIPVVNVRDLGFFFEPDPATRLFKLCPLGAGFVNTNKSNGISLPPPDRLPPPQDYIPAEDERKLRRLLQETFPWMANRPFVDQKLCWFSDTKDSEYCIDFVPGTENSLVVLSGDSGHGFKMMPIFGEWVVDLLQNGKQKLERWQWRKEDQRGVDWGSSVNWRIGETRELKELIVEKEGMVKARL